MFDKLSDKMKEMIRKSPEYDVLMAPPTTIIETALLGMHDNGMGAYADEDIPFADPYGRHYTPIGI